MDDLDRLAFRLVRTIRQHHPQLRERGFTLTDLEERLLPYREARREMADSSAGTWERSLLRLVGGERGYVDAGVELQQACRHALAAPSPTIALVRSWSGSSLMLGASAEQVGSERVSGAFGAAALSSVNSFDRSAQAAPQGAVGSVSHAELSKATTGGAISASTRGAGTVLPTPMGHKTGCRFCGGRLPEGRGVTYCPHCGLDQTKRQCPACSTELDAAWRFCVTCGRNADLPDAPIQLKRAAG